METIVIELGGPASPIVVGVMDFSRALGWQALLQMGEGGPVLKLVDDQFDGEADVTTAEVVEGGTLAGSELPCGSKVQFIRDGPVPAAGRSVYELLLQAA